MLRPDYGRAVVIRPLPNVVAYGPANGQPECGLLVEFEPGVWRDCHMARRGVQAAVSTQFAKTAFVRVVWWGGLRLRAESTK
jgi:hypothetical protein